jgi:nitrilase
MKIAAIQASPVFLDRKATTEKALTLIREAADNGAELCVFPEVFISGYPAWIRPQFISKFSPVEHQAALAAYIESGIATDGPELAAICAESARLEVFIYLGFLEPAPSGGTVYCSLAAIHPSHGILCVHRKLKPTYHERMVWCQGDGHGLRVHQWREFRVGGLNCYENWLPQARFALYAQGEQLHVATWPGRPELTQDITRFIAMEGRVYVASVSGLLAAEDIPDTFPLRQGLLAEERRFNTGGTMIAGPDGTTICGPVSDQETILYAELDVKQVQGARTHLDPAGHYNRPDVFGFQVNRNRQVPMSEVPAGIVSEWCRGESFPSFHSI